MAHTPTPWEAQNYIDGEDGIGIIGLREGVPVGGTPTNGLVAFATMFPTEVDAKNSSRATANAAFIVKAVNAHDDLVAAVTELRAAMVQYGMDVDEGPNGVPYAHTEMMERARAALAKAGATS